MRRSCKVVVLILTLLCLFLGSSVVLAQSQGAKLEPIRDLRFTDPESIGQWSAPDWVVEDGVLRSPPKEFATAHFVLTPITLGTDTDLFVLEAEYRPTSLARTTHFYLGLRDSTRRDGFHALVFSTERYNKYTIHYRAGASDILYLAEDPGPKDPVDEWTTLRLEISSDGRIAIYANGKKVSECRVLPEDTNREYHTVTIVTRDIDVQYEFKRITLSAATNDQ